jgi:hypothetical protein
LGAGDGEDDEDEEEEAEQVVELVLVDGGEDEEELDEAGTKGFYAAYTFIRKIYGAVKID